MPNPVDAAKGRFLWFHAEMYRQARESGEANQFFFTVTNKYFDTFGIHPLNESFWDGDGKREDKEKPFTPEEMVIKKQVRKGIRAWYAYHRNHFGPESE